MNSYQNYPNELYQLGQWASGFFAGVNLSHVVKSLAEEEETQKDRTNREVSELQMEITISNNVSSLFLLPQTFLVLQHNVLVHAAVHLQSHHKKKNNKKKKTEKIKQTISCFDRKMSKRYKKHLLRTFYLRGLNVVSISGYVTRHSEISNFCHQAASNQNISRSKVTMNTLCLQRKKII